MSGNGRAHKISQVVDPVQDLDDVIRLIHFLGKSKPRGFSATLGWVAERLQMVRETVVECEPERGRAEGLIALMEDNANPSPLPANAAESPVKGTVSGMCPSADQGRETEEPGVKDVDIVYKGNNLYAFNFLHNVQELIDHAVGLILNKLRHSNSGDELPRIYVEHCPEEVRNEESMGDLRCLKVYAEGYGPCIVMVY